MAGSDSPVRTVGLNYGTAPLPVDDANPDLYGGGYTTGNIAGIPKRAEHPEQGWALLKFLATDDHGATVHLANPSGLNWGTRRVKNDERDAIDLIDMLRLGRLPRAWIARTPARARLP